MRNRLLTRLHQPKNHRRNHERNHLISHRLDHDAVSRSAAQLAEAAVERRVAACGNIIPAIHSVFRWNGNVQREQEALLLLKTRADLFEELKTFVISRHPYDVPEIIALPIIAGYEKYLDWIAQETSNEETR